MGPTINPVRDDVDGPLPTGLCRVCRDISHEVFDCYYSANTFLLDLSKPEYAPSRFINGTKGLLQYMPHVRILELVVEDSFPWRSVRLRARAIRLVSENLARSQKESPKGPGSGNFTVLDHCQTLTARAITQRTAECTQKRRDVLVWLLGSFISRIRRVRIEKSRAVSQKPADSTRRGSLVGTLLFPLALLPSTSFRCIIARNFD